MGVTRIIEVTNPDAYDGEYLRELFDRAFENQDDLEADAVREFVRDVFEFDVSTLVALQDAQARGLMIVDGSTNPLMPYGFILHLYAETRDARRTLVDAARGWFLARGVKHVIGWNRTGRSDKAHARLFRPHVVHAEPMGGVNRFDLE